MQRMLNSMKSINILIALSVLFFIGLSAVSAYVKIGSCQTDICRGKAFAINNDLKSVDDCKYINRPYFKENVSKEYMRGCIEYLKKNTLSK